MTKLDDPTLAFITRAFLWDVERDLARNRYQSHLSTRVSHSFEQGIQLVRGVDLNTGFRNWYTRCKAQYQKKFNISTNLFQVVEVELILPKMGLTINPSLALMEA